MAWSNDNLEKFIELYRSYPCLWKVKSDEYRNRSLKNRAYDKLIEFCKSAVCPNANKDFVIKKIQGIRGSFRKEPRKLQETLKSGCGEEDVHKPSLWYFDLLLFTKDQEEPMASRSNIESDMDISEHTTESELLEEPDESEDQEKETVSTVIIVILFSVIRTVIQHPFLTFHLAMVPCHHY